MKRFDLCVRGSGVVGQTLALSLARQGLHVALVHEIAVATGRPDDVRAFALNAASQDLLASLKVWDALPASARTPVHEMRIAGDSPAGHLSFSAWQQRTTELATIADAVQLELALSDAVRYAPHITVLSQVPETALLLLCEGRASSSRDAVAADFVRHPSGQCAIAARLTSEHPHQHIAHQWFQSPDVLALLPFDAPQPAHSYALVWSMPEAQAQSLMQSEPLAFEAQLQSATQDACGPLRLASARAIWPLAHGIASQWSGPGWALVGDCAHVVHPLAGQGLNLGLADVRALCRVIAEREPWRGLGDPKLLRRYARMRLAPTQAMGQVTDGLLHLFSSHDANLRSLRNHGMGLLNRLPSLKRWLTTRATHS
jgi:2-polyprenyl-6-methoxyphenol hydroxylase-like FAD-dependent oxidoreductase